MQRKGVPEGGTVAHWYRKLDGRTELLFTCGFSRDPIIRVCYVRLNKNQPGRRGLVTAFCHFTHVNRHRVLLDGVHTR